jgi:CubicO group peptidase (beta-lactamase class C family)
MHQHFSMDRRALLAGAGALAFAPMACAPRGQPVEYSAVPAFLDEFIDSVRLAHGVVAVVRPGADVVYFARGNTALDSDVPVGADSIYRIYSMSKPVTGIAFMKLVEDGVLGLDQPIADVLPEFSEPVVWSNGDVSDVRPAASPILMCHLMTHTSGLSYAINGQQPSAALYTRYGLTAGSRDVAATVAEEDGLYPPARDLETFGRRLALLPLDFDPGTRWQYSVGLDLMGLVIQRAAGMPFVDYLKQTIFGPLGMNDTDFVVPSSKLDRLTSVYSPDPEGGPLIETDDRDDSPFHRDRDLPSGGGGLVSTAQDYARFTGMLLGEGELDGVRILSPETVATARSNLMDPGVDTAGTYAGAGNGFGAAVQVLGAASEAGEGAGTYGWDGAAGTTMWVDPVNQVSVIGLVQTFGGASIHNPLRVAAYQDLSAAGLTSQS